MVKVIRMISKDEKVTMNSVSGLNKKYLFLISLAAGLGGFLFGFDTSVASGTIGFLRVQFDLDLGMEGWVMSSALVGSIVGAAISGFLSDRFGRKSILMVSALLFFISALGTMLPETVSELISYRIVGGVGVGIAAMVSPLYISELSPPQLRGRLVSFYQLAITIGILVSYLSNTSLLSYSESANLDSGFVKRIFSDEVWRAMFGSEIFPSILFFVLLFFVPKSPRWLIKVGKSGEALKTLIKVHGEEAAQKEIKEIQETVEDESKGITQLFQKKLRPALIIGIILPLFAQMTGICAVIYYAPTVFEMAGFQSDSAFGTAAIIGFFNMLFTFVAIWKIDTWGRKPLLIFGFIGLGITLFLIAAMLQLQSSIPGGIGNLIVVFLFITYIALFAATVGPGPWVVISEIYPTKIRGRAMAIGTLATFVGSVIVTQTFPLLRDWLGMDYTFLIYGVFMIPAAWFVWKKMPETKNKTLEEIEKQWFKNE